MGCVFHASCRQSCIGRLACGNGTIHFDPVRHVCAGAFFLPHFVPDGSDIFSSSGISIFCTQKRQGKLHSGVCGMYEKMSIGYRTAGNWLDRDKR